MYKSSIAMASSEIEAVLIFFDKAKSYPNLECSSRLPENCINGHGSELRAPVITQNRSRLHVLYMHCHCQTHMVRSNLGANRASMVLRLHPISPAGGVRS
jgi:hypothetical protein